MTREDFEIYKNSKYFTIEDFQEGIRIRKEMIEKLEKEIEDFEKLIEYKS